MAASSWANVSSDCSMVWLLFICLKILSLKFQITPETWGKRESYPKILRNNEWYKAGICSSSAASKSYFSSHVTKETNPAHGQVFRPHLYEATPPMSLGLFILPQLTI